MTEKNEKRLTMRQELRAAAEAKLPEITLSATNEMIKLAESHGVNWEDLVKAIGQGGTKTAEHNLVTQLANKAETDLIAIWNDQQALDLGEKNVDK